jgi:hypothetical protein
MQGKPLGTKRGNSPGIHDLARSAQRFSLGACVSETGPDTLHDQTAFTPEGTNAMKTKYFMAGKPVSRILKKHIENA